MTTSLLPKESLTYISNYIKNIKDKDNLDEVIFLSRSENTEFYIQFILQNNNNILCEAAGNEYLKPDQQLKLNQQILLQDLGWVLNTKGNYSQSNRFNFSEQGINDAVVLGYDTLCKVYGAGQDAIWRIDHSFDLDGDTELDDDTELDGDNYFEEITDFDRKLKERTFGNVKKTVNGWCVTPLEDFSLTINCQSEDIAQKAHDLLYELIPTRPINGLYDELALLMVNSQIECLELKSYFDKTIVQYRSLLDSIKKKYLVSNSTKQFTKSSLNQIYREATAGLNISWRFAKLFEHTDSSSWIYRGDISSCYDSQMLRFYLKRYKEKLNKAWIVKPDHQFAKIAKLCADSGLARTGRNIPIECLAKLVTVKDLNKVLKATYRHREEATKDLLNRPQPYYLLESIIDLKFCYEFFITFDESDINNFLLACDWAEAATELIRSTVNGGDSRWTKSENKLPNLSDNVIKKLIEIHREDDILQKSILEKHRSERDPIYGGNPEIILTPKNDSDLIRLGYWSYWLEIMLDSPRVKESKYQDVLNKIANHLILLIPVVNNELRLSAEQMAKSHHDEIALRVATYKNNTVLRHVNNNKSLSKYVKYLSLEGQFDKAIKICELCISNGIHDGTKGGFSQRHGGLIKTSNKLTGTKKPSKKFGKVSSEQIAEIQKIYPICNSLERLRLAQEFGLTKTHLYYIISKNK